MHMEDEELGPPSVCMVYEIAVPSYSNIHVKNISAACKSGMCVPTPQR